MTSVALTAARGVVSVQIGMYLSVIWAAMRSGFPWCSANHCRDGFQATETKPPGNQHDRPAVASLVGQEPTVPKISQFPSPSAALVMGPNILLFQGGTPDKSGTHSIQMLSAPIPPTNTAPQFSVPQITDQSGAGPVTNGIITSVAASVPPIALTLDGVNVQLLHATTADSYGIYAQVFAWNGTGYDRTASATPSTQWSLQEGPKVTFGAATVPGEAAYLVAYAPGAGDKQVALQYGSAAGGMAYTPWLSGPDDPNWQGDVTMTIVRNQIDGTPDEPNLILLVYQAGQTLYAASIRMGAIPEDDSAPNINTGSLQMQALSTDSDFSVTTPASVSLHRGPDGVAYLMFMDKQWKTLHWGSVSCAAGGVPQFSGLPASAYYDIGRIPPVVYSSGAFPDPSVSGNSAKVPVYRTTVFDAKATEIVQIGTALRTITTEPGPAQPVGMLIGYVEGGPPVPNGNVQAIDHNVQTIVATMTYGVETGQDTDTAYTFSVGAVVKMSEESGVPWVGSVDVDMDLDAGYTGKWTQSTEEMLLTAFTVDTEIEKVHTEIDAAGHGVNVVQCEGMAFVYLAQSFTAWQYQFLDADGTPDPLATTYVQLVPNEPLIINKAYEIDPNGALWPIPGNLPTYFMTPEQVSALEQQAAIKCAVSDTSTKPPTPRSGSFPETSWAPGGDYEEDVAILVKGTAQNGFFADASVMIGGTVLGTKVQAGLQTKFDFDSGWGSSQTSRYGSKITVSVNDKAPGTYSSYAFKTLLLAPNASYTSDLLQRLEYDDPLGRNADLKNLIHPNSTPWKITYAVLYHDP